MSTNESTNAEFSIPKSEELLWCQLCQSLGWHWPPLNPHTDEHRVRSRVLVDFGRLTELVQRSLLRFGELSHRSRGPDMIDCSADAVQRLYWTTWPIRAAMLEAIDLAVHGRYPDPDTRAFCDLSGWSELAWLELNKNKPSAGIQIDYPLKVHFLATDPLLGPGASLPHPPQAESRMIELAHRPAKGGWSLGFQRTPYPVHEINFSHSHACPSVRVPHHIGELGHVWFDDGEAGSGRRILFRKTADESNLTLLLWPQYQPAHHEAECILSPPPRIPVYQYEIIELCNEDRLLLFASSFASHRIHITIQFTIRFEWASESSPKTSAWVPHHFNWPNPTERYSHYLARPKGIPALIDEDESFSELVPSMATTPSPLTPEASDQEGDETKGPGIVPKYSGPTPASHLKRSIDQTLDPVEVQTELEHDHTSLRPKIPLPSSSPLSSSVESRASISEPENTKPSTRPSRRRHVSGPTADERLIASMGRRASLRKREQVKSPSEKVGE
ncbi:hypothetical protein CROQUDRAFT_655410 [Cronartium quercuum f. sp. fusiforme G11]|uniref:Uncharacterized protein n=1 Tax=Cronartium quercuum f. sp. fusiforme G11 TaxID=708437 RepID=A0A9P6NPT0_9BASI|nr:hypothetical protein CROQUDRAFT_655410 [Cronartium quercuum f. sp. fusiforme G11]